MLSFSARHTDSLAERTWRRLTGPLVIVVALAWAAVAAAAPVHTPHVEAELLAERTALVPGEPLTVALRLRMAPGWHVYWQNPGDSGVPTTIAWDLPAGITAGPIQWPAPRALPAGPLINYGYEGEVLHLVELAVPASLAAVGTQTLRARVDWLVCKEACIPESVELGLTLPAAASAEANPASATTIAATRRALPRALAGWQASAAGQGTSITLRLAPPTGAGDPGTLRFFPFAERQIEASAPQTLARAGNTYLLTLPVASDLAGPLPRLSGVLTASGTLGEAITAATLDLPLAGHVVPGARPDLATRTPVGPHPSPAAAALTLWLAALSALAGGLLLNLMPCVFPVLSIKVLGFATHHDRPSTLHKEAFAYATGVVLTFVALGLALLALRAAGEQLGWGFQLQSPVVVTALAALFFVLALNLSGVFEFGQFAPASLIGLSARRRSLDAFAAGVLAVVVASPCTAPFMGAALGFALAGSAWVTLLVFAALGIGMALPYVLLACFPGWRQHLPRPGAWLGRFKQLLAYPLYATVIWLVWVLGAQTDNDSVVRLLLALLGIGFALWAWRILREGGTRLWAAAIAVALLGVALVAWPLLTRSHEVRVNTPKGTGTAATSDSEWEAFTPTRLAELSGAGRTVFVDFTAAWCVTCQVNKRLVLNDGEIRSAFAHKQVALLRADWTRRDPAITQALTALGRSGVPVYVLYRPGREPLLLPEVLQRQTVLAALAPL
ncbi:thioredoxin family protein [Accumulibacter sp.]|uniref:protein-disulfide reductase DsbD family protein n=1 Tax=Accumulibacter sp. TaxID=2053492 RepID=UPI00261AD58F|nr:thioredoxin family protein [Accumulibacter sp.]